MTSERTYNITETGTGIVLNEHSHLGCLLASTPARDGLSVWLTDDEQDVEIMMGVGDAWVPIVYGPETPA